MNFQWDRNIRTQGFKNPGPVKQIVRNEMKNWWALQKEGGPLPSFTALVEKINHSVYCEIEIHDWGTTWTGSGCDHGVAPAVRRALNRLHPKSGPGVTLLSGPPFVPPMEPAF